MGGYDDRLRIATGGWMGGCNARFKDWYLVKKTCFTTTGSFTALWKISWKRKKIVYSTERLVVRAVNVSGDSV